MDRNEYLHLCQKASYITATSGAWWAVQWDDALLVLWRGDKYIPYDYRFGFDKGNVTGVAIIRDMRTNTEYQVRLDDVQALSK